MQEPDRGLQGASGAPDHRFAQGVFELVPHGIMVMDRAGTLLASNPKARELLGDPRGGWDGGEIRCCSLFGCRTGDGVLANACLAELTLERGGELPEIRLDLDGGRAVWLTASAPPDRQPHLVLGLRWGHPRDRRKRTMTHWTGPPELQIRALGHARVSSREGPIEGVWLQQRPGQVLKYLVCHRHRPVTIEEIAGAIWPDRGRRGLNSVRHYVHRLRSCLEPDRPERAPSAFIVAHRGGYALDPRNVRVDIDEFVDHLDAGFAASTAREHDVARERLAAGLALYEGDLFAEDPYELWILDERDELRDLAVRGLRLLAELRVKAGLNGAAHEDFKRLARMQPFDLEIQRALIESCLRLRRRSEASRRYHSLRQQMLHEFGEDLDFEFVELVNGADEVP